MKELHFYRIIIKQSSKNTISVSCLDKEVFLNREQFESKLTLMGVKPNEFDLWLNNDKGIFSQEAYDIWFERKN